MVDEIEIDEIKGDIERAFELFKDRWEPKTQAPYKVGCTDFAKFCRDEGVLALPTSPETIVAFLLARESTQATSGLAQRLAVIRGLHAAAKERLPRGAPDRDRYTLDDPIITKTWKEIERRKKGEEAPRKAVRSQELEAILRQIPDDRRGAQDRAILCIGLAYALKRSEIVALDRDDLEIKDGAMRISIRRSERDQDHPPDERTVARTGTETCPVTAMERWLEVSKITQGAVFKSNRGNRQGSKYPATILQKYGASAGFNREDLGAESLRKGYILGHIQKIAEVKALMDFARIEPASYFEYLNAEVAHLDEISSEERDIAEIETDQNLSEMEKKTLIDARRGQGKFRNELRKRWDDACAVTGCTVLEVLRASHIQPWKPSTNAERLNPANGLLLDANLDALFDKHLISFADDGQMLFAASITEHDRRLLGVPGRLRKLLNNDEKRFLAKHRAAGGFADSDVA